MQPRGIGLITSLGAAALHDVVTALRRRVPHIPVVLIPLAAIGALVLLVDAAMVPFGVAGCGSPELPATTLR